MGGVVLSMASSGHSRDNLTGQQGPVWEVVREEVEYEEPVCYYGSPTYVQTSSAHPSGSPVIVRPASTTVTRYVSPVYSQVDVVPMGEYPVTCTSPAAVPQHSGVMQSSPGRVVSRRVIRYASPVRSRITTTTYRCTPSSPWQYGEGSGSIMTSSPPPGAAEVLPSYGVPGYNLRTPRRGREEGEVSQADFDCDRPFTAPREGAGCGGSSYPRSCKKSELSEEPVSERAAPEPVPSIPQTVESKGKHRSPKSGTPMSRRPLYEYHEEEEGQDKGYDESMEMEPDPTNVAVQCRRRSSGSLVFSDSDGDDDDAGSPPRKKRLSTKKPPTPLAASRGAQTDDVVEDDPPCDSDEGGGGGLRSPGREFLSLDVQACRGVSPGRAYLSPVYRERSRELKEKEAELEQFLQESARRRGRLIESIKKRRRESDGEGSAAGGLELPKVGAVGRWGEVEESRPAGGGGAAFRRKPWSPPPFKAIEQEGPREREWKKGIYPPPPLTAREQTRREAVHVDEPDPVTSNGCFVSEGKHRPVGRRSLGDTRTVYGDASPLPLHGSYHRTIIPRVQRLFGEGAPYAPIDDNQWKELANRLRRQAESHTISVD
ncbi:hypothetical protein FOL47_009548, partial [Perkinsus chesapeaki]